MNDLWTVIVSIIIAGFVGGITNHLAIKMLFYPRRELRFAGRRVPFTPGLIPKRKDEIGCSLGRVVADHLVTAEGLKGMLDKPEFRSRVDDKLKSYVEKWAAREETVEEMLLWLWPQDKLAAGKEALFRWLGQRTRQGAEWLWEKQGVADCKLGGLLPGWSEERREQLIAGAVALLIGHIRAELDTVRGERMLRQMAAQFMEQAGGFLGALAGMFLDGEKLAQKVKQALLQQLESPALQQFAADLIRGKLAAFERMTLAEAVRSATGRDPKEWVGEQAERFADWRRWSEPLFAMKLSELLGPRRECLIERIPAVSGRLLGLLAANMERLVAAIQLPKLVEEEVGKFPIEQVERIILSLSGKEFRAITWLGVLLGGLIGLMQSLLMIWAR